MTVIPGRGLKNWKSNPKTAAKVNRVDGPKDPVFGGVYQREHFDGHQDGRVGGSYVDPETEERWRKGLIVVNGLQPVTLADLEKAMLAAKIKYQNNRDDPQARAAFKQLKDDLSAARENARRQDPRRQAALRGR